MKKVFKKAFIVLFTAIILLTGTAPISNAASKHLIIVNTYKNTLNYYVNYTLVKEFRCATGKSSTPTPQRKTTIVNKIKNRPYYTNGIPGGDPTNPLGKRWMGLNIGTYGETYAIHGNNNESSIGKNVSGGCIRMHNSEVEWLFDQVTLGTVVLIKNTPNSDTYIADYYNVETLKNVWFDEGGNKYFRKSDGYLAKGWNTINGKTYYFKKANGVMLTGWRTVSGSRYYLGTDGVRRTGWNTINDKTYYFGKTKGKLFTGWAKLLGKTYYLGTDGVKRTGWINVNGYKYYLGTDGVMRTGWNTINGKTYYFGKTKGKLFTGWSTLLGKTYYLGKDGVKRTGWLTLGEKTYYLGTDGVMVKGQQVIDGETYNFDDNGVLIENNSNDSNSNNSNDLNDDNDTNNSGDNEYETNLNIGLSTDENTESSDN